MSTGGINIYRKGKKQEQMNPEYRKNEYVNMLKKEKSAGLINFD